MKSLTTSVALMALMLGTPAFPSSDGVPGPTSSGSFTVNATVSQPTTDNVHVFGLDDFSLAFAQGALPGEPGTFDSKNFCIIRSPAGGIVNVTVSSFDATDTDYLVKAPGGGSQVELVMSIHNQNDGITTDLVEGTPLTNIQVSSSCDEASGVATLLVLNVVTAGVVTADPGIYSGSFLVTVAPN